MRGWWRFRAGGLNRPDGWRGDGHSDVLIETDLDAVLSRDDVDVLAVCTPHDLHPENTIAAAKAGKHVLIEKPAALAWEVSGGDAGGVAAAGVRRW